MKPNNVNMTGMMAFVEQAKSDPAVLKKQKRVDGVWNLAEGQPQFAATLAYPAGERTLETDLPPFMGGAGLAPDPIQYCLFGLAACFAGTFVSLAAMDGVTLSSLRVIAENQLDLTRPMGLGDKPVVEKVTLRLLVESDADDARLQELERLARERCPGVYCLTQPIPLETRVERPR
ncbi:MAG: OsmC family protein [Acidobacteriota bacterium]